MFLFSKHLRGEKNNLSPCRKCPCSNNKTELNNLITTKKKFNHPRTCHIVTKKNKKQIKQIFLNMLLVKLCKAKLKLLSCKTHLFSEATDSVVLLEFCVAESNK